MRETMNERSGRHSMSHELTSRIRNGTEHRSVPFLIHKVLCNNSWKEYVIE